MHHYHSITLNYSVGRGPLSPTVAELEVTIPSIQQEPPLKNLVLEKISLVNVETQEFVHKVQRQ